ncbi:Fe-S cluster biogenesis protein NfuA, 4Fe-4S-binding domain [Siphonobacter aquaeclarae]|uniref:Fe-S cluster biogenesis protein NfuA, 4Fe-4S-binding domain n=2 Tax=Siphonobacter aquaeclarae TaxID=563176 RepID=A0A1G9STB6_9BACT|nr:Fe-S cluster biogenesis protein NfuA, 4Fe-4S-binding domain [Siphonobacter aquaeclarae]
MPQTTYYTRNMETKLEHPLSEKVEQALNSIRPYLEADGGNVRVTEITDDNVVRLELVGACGSCSMSAMTFKGGIEDAIRRQVPEVSGIEAINL